MQQAHSSTHTSTPLSTLCYTTLLLAELCALLTDCAGRQLKCESDTQPQLQHCGADAAPRRSMSNES